MKRFWLFLACLNSVFLCGQEILISFSGTGASSSVSTVKVENLTSGLTITLNGNDILRLTGTTGTDRNIFGKSNGMNIFPNPMSEFTIAEVYPPVQGEAIITVSDITGRKVLSESYFLTGDLQQFRITGLGKGLHILDVTGTGYRISGKLISVEDYPGRPDIEIQYNDKPDVSYEEKENEIKGAKGNVDMLYTAGDRLKFTAYSGNYSTVISDIPEGNKTLTFGFVQCTDGSSNNYSAVQIGTQTWMAVNLKTIKYNDNSEIPLVTDVTPWASLTTPGYCWYANSEDPNRDKYGALYNWYAVATGKLCPSGWHVPSHDEWTILESFMIAGGYNFDNTTSGNKISKALSATSGWTLSTTAGSPGKSDYPDKRNASGFSAVGGGYRISNGTFSSAGTHNYWWSSTQESSSYAYHRLIMYNTIDITSYNYNKKMGMYVRCIKD